MSEERALWAREVIHHLTGIPHAARRALTLRYFACLDSAAVAERTRTSPAAVRADTAHGLLELGRRLQRAADVPD